MFAGVSGELRAGVAFSAWIMSLRAALSIAAARISITGSVTRRALMASSTGPGLPVAVLLRVEGVEQVKESKYIMLHAPRSALPAIRQLLPGSESPTIIPLEGSPDRVAVHAVCRENVFWETLESLKKAGASAILVLPVEKMLA